MINKYVSIETKTEIHTGELANEIDEKVLVHNLANLDNDSFFMFMCKESNIIVVKSEILSIFHTFCKSKG